MSERQNTLAGVWPDDTRTFGTLTVGRPSPHRLNVLMRRRNKWAADNPREQTDLEAVAEWLFVLSRSQEELTAMFRDSLEAWELSLDSFLAEHGDVMDEWQEYLTGILASIEAGAVEPADQPGKPQRKEGPSRAS